jgi:hypothetical protein
MDFYSLFTLQMDLVPVDENGAGGFAVLLPIAFETFFKRSPSAKSRWYVLHRVRKSRVRRASPTSAAHGSAQCENAPSLLTSMR